MAVVAMSPGQVLAVIRAHAAVSRSRLGALTGLSRTAVNTRVETLVGMGLVTEGELSPSTGGRPATSLQLNPHAGTVLAVSLEHGRVQAGLSDLTGEMIEQSAFDVGADVDPARILDDIVELLRALLGPPGRSARLWGIGVCAAAAVDVRGRPSGTVRRWPEGYAAVRDHLRETFDVTVCLDNDVNILAGAERLARPHVNDLLVLKLSAGIGAAVIAGGELQRGAWGVAGEIGHTRVYGGELVCTCGSRGCLETVAGGSALIAGATALGRDVDTLAQLIDLAQAGDAIATSVVRQAGRHLGEVVAAAVNLLNPAVVVLRGEVAGAFEPLAAGLREVIFRDATSSATGNLRIEPGAPSACSELQACAAMVLDQILSPPAVDGKAFELAESGASRGVRP